MALIKAGYWTTTYWADSYWMQDYWTEYAFILKRKNRQPNDDFLWMSRPTAILHEYEVVRA